ncbi:MAG: hypothetical protein GY809_01930, partial [Planctomycetes bacterium]|nr:hypothetical protein [Planctomycetota bacterium]
MHHLPFKQWLGVVAVILLLYTLWASSQERRGVPALRPEKQRTTAPDTTEATDATPLESEGPSIPKAPFTKSDISMVFQIISDSTGWSIFPSPEVAKATVTLYAHDISAQALLDHVVSVAGFVYHREGDIITVMTYKEYEQAYEVAKEVVHLAYARAESVGKVIKPFLTDLGKSEIHKETNMIVLYEVPANLEPISAIIRKLDSPAVSSLVEIVNLRYAQCDEVAKILNEVYKPSETHRVNRTEPSKAIRTRLEQAHPDPDTLPQDQVGIFPVVHANQLVIVGIEKDVQRILGLVEEIDVSGENLQLEVISLEYADAAMVAETLEAVFGGQTTNSGRLTSPRNPVRTAHAKTGAPSSSLASLGLYTHIDVIAIERTNQIIIKAFSADMERALKLVAQLDVFAEPTTQTYHFSYADASQVFEGLDRTLGIYQGYPQSANRSGSSKIASQSSQSDYGVTLIERTNSVLLTGPPSAHRIMQSICDRVDVPG